MPTRPTLKPAPKRPPAAKAATAPGPPPLKKSARRAKHIDRLKADLSALRGMLQETQEHYQVRTGGLLAQMLLVVDPPEGAARPVLPSRKAVDQMLEAVRTLKVKPKKGRGKDLQRIQDLLEALWVMFPPQP